MKKLLVILMMSVIPVISFAQRGVPRSNSVSVSVKRVTETTKEPKTYNARVGFQQMAGLNIGAYDFDACGVGLSYVGGFRFNDVLFAGCGVEVNTPFFGFDIPLYAQIRTYFTKRIWRPYVSLSLGGYYTDNEYYGHEYFGEGGGFYGDFSVGVDVRLVEKLNLFMGAGVNNRGVFFKTGLSF